MKARAEEYIGDKVDLAVLTVPAYFNQKQRCWLLVRLGGSRQAADGRCAAPADPWPSCPSCSGTLPAARPRLPALPLQHAATVAGLEARLSSDGGVAGLACMLKRGGRSDESEPVLTLDVGGGGLNASLCKLDEGIVEASDCQGGTPGV